MSNMVEQLQELVIKAGDILLKYFALEVEVINKLDNSPQTIADIESDKFLKESIESKFGIPVISEESYDYELFYHDRYFLIDPLDGTKEFVNKIGEFSIALALIEKNELVLGIIYAPVLGEMYTAELGKGFTYINYKDHQPRVKTNNKIRNDQIDMVTSRYNDHPGVKEVAEMIGAKSITKVGASLKFGRLARGDHNFYLRFEGSKEWDTAAGQLMLEEQGFEVIDLKTMRRMIYKKDSIINNPFITYHKSLEFNKERVFEYIGNILSINIK